MVIPGNKVLKKYFMLNLALNAHKYKDIKKIKHFQAHISFIECYFSCSKYLIFMSRKNFMLS